MFRSLRFLLSVVAALMLAGCIVERCEWHPENKAGAPSADSGAESSTIEDSPMESAP